MTRISFSTSASSPSPKIAMVAKLRKETECSISKVKESLSATGFNYEKALQWLQEDMEKSAAKKAEKLKDRSVVEGLVGITHHTFGMHASLIEINCETDFVAKSSQFCQLVQQIANTAALLENSNSSGTTAITAINIENLLEKRLIGGEVDGTVEGGIRHYIGKLGENIKSRRGVVAHQNLEGNLIFGAYAHAAGQLVPAGLGRLGSLVAIQSTSSINHIEMEKRKVVAEFAKKVAQHISGFNPSRISTSSNAAGEALLEQSFLFGGGTVEEVLGNLSKSTGLELAIVDFQRIECGQGLEKETSDFASEVQQQASKNKLLF